MTVSDNSPRILTATTWHPLDGLPTYCPFTQRMIEACRESGLDVDLVRPVPWYHWFKQRRRITDSGKSRFPISWKPHPATSKSYGGECLANSVLRSIRDSDKTYDVVHIHGLDSNLLMGEIVAETLGIPLILHAHDTSIPLDTDSARALGKATRILAVSEYQKRLILETHPELEDRVRVLFNGIPTRFFDVPRIGGQRMGALRAVFVGRLHWNKGLDWLLANWKTIRSPTDQLDLIGLGPQESELRKIVEDEGVGDSVRFIGEIPNSKLPEVLARYDVSLSPTRLETFGIANVESLAVGLPLIVSDLPITREVLADSIGVHLVELENTKAFAEAMDCIRRNSTSTNAIRQSVRRYEMRTTIASLADHYVEVARTAARKSVGNHQR